MRVVFAGSPGISTASLKAVVSWYEVCCVLTNTDKPAGRGRTPQPVPLAAAAAELGIPLVKADRVDEKTEENIRSRSPDILVVVAYGHIFSPDFLRLFPEGGVNLHHSLLPKYRGPSPITAAILNGDTETGITIQRLAREMDAGDIILQESFSLTGKETTGSLTDFCSLTGADLLLRALDLLSAGTAEFCPQNPEDASWCGLIRKTDGIVDWQLSSSAIERMIRAYNPWPYATTVFRGKNLRLLRASVYGGGVTVGASTAVRPGMVAGIDKEEGILIQTGNGILLVKELQMEAKKPLDWRSFLNGHPGFIGSFLGAPA
ncbi:MAG: methionyl-tRNA formyltransferase [Spirochaetales bacterium]|nr:MAG: methionyl-tRNA formyltransferase [Spirochaetales bacterium]